MDLDDHGLPAILDPAFDWLATKIPPAMVDNLIIPALSKLFGFSTSLFELFSTVTSGKPGAWDMEKILPPIMTLLAAYLALLSFYRTTSWMIKTSMWFVKWGSLLGALAGGAGYLAGQNGGGDMVNGIKNLVQGGTMGIAKAVGGAMWDAINSPGNNNDEGQRGRRTRTRTRTAGSTADKAAQKIFGKATSDKDKTKAKSKSQSKSKSGYAYDPRGANDQHDQRDAAPPVDAQKIMGQIVGFAEKMGWMGVVKDIIGGGGKSHSEDDDEDDEPSASRSSRRGSR
jgi:hypothetical protein